eukprot:jgi/Botrbrau1/2188/Bobra.101_2s0021.2
MSSLVHSGGSTVLDLRPCLHSSRTPEPARRKNQPCLAGPSCACNCLAAVVQDLTTQIEQTCPLDSASLKGLIQKGLSLYIANHQQLQSLRQLLQEQGIDVQELSKDSQECSRVTNFRRTGLSNDPDAVSEVLNEDMNVSSLEKPLKGGIKDEELFQVMKFVDSLPSDTESSPRDFPSTCLRGEFVIPLPSKEGTCGSGVDVSNKQNCCGPRKTTIPKLGLESPRPSLTAGKDLEYLSLETPLCTSRDTAFRDSVCYSGNGLEHLSLELSPGSKQLLERLNSEPGPRKKNIKRDAMAWRLATGEAPWDMLSLKAAINFAKPGTGEVQKIIKTIAFQPQAAAFTAVLHMCGKGKSWEKALEIFQAMKAYHPSVINTVHYSSVISACASAGQLEEAWKVFEEMKSTANADPNCKPNVITYSALMTACCAGGQPEKAYDVFQEMQAAGIQPDQISYSTLIAGFDRNGDMEKATQIFNDFLRTGLPLAGLSGAAAKPSFLEQFRRKLARQAINSGKTPSSLKAPSHTPLSIRVAQPKRPLAMCNTPNILGTPPLCIDWVSTPFGAMPTPLSMGTSEDFISAKHGAHYHSNTGSPYFAENKYQPFRSIHSSTQGPRDCSHDNLTPVHAVTPTCSAITGPFSTGFTDFNSQQHGQLPMDSLNIADQRLQRQTSLLSNYTLFGEQQGQSVVHLPRHFGSQTIGTTEFAASINSVQASISQVEVVAATNIPPILHNEYQSLPLQNSRQLSLDQLNGALAYIAELTAQNGNNGAGYVFKVEDLAPLLLTPQQVTALLSILLHSKRIWIHVVGGQYYYEVNRNPHSSTYHG